MANSTESSEALMETEDNVDLDISNIAKNITASNLQNAQDLISEDESQNVPSGRLDLPSIESWLKNPPAIQPSLKDKTGSLVQTFVKMCMVADPSEWRKLFSDVEEDEEADPKDFDLVGSKSQKKKKKQNNKPPIKAVQKWQIALQKVSWQSIVNDIYSNSEGPKPPYGTTTNQARSCKRLFKHRHENDDVNENKCIFGDVLCALMVKLYYARFGPKTIEDQRRILGQRIVMGYEFALEINKMWQYRLVMSDTFLEAYRFALSDMSDKAEWTVIADYGPSNVQIDDLEVQNVPYLPKGTIPDLIPYEKQIQTTKRKMEQVAAQIELHESTVHSLKKDKLKLEEEITVLEDKKRIQEENQQISSKVRSMVPEGFEFSTTITTLLKISEMIIAKCQKAKVYDLKKFDAQLNFQDLLQESQTFEDSQQMREQTPRQNRGSNEENSEIQEHLPKKQRKDKSSVNNRSETDEVSPKNQEPSGNSQVIPANADTLQSTNHRGSSSQEEGEGDYSSQVSEDHRVQLLEKDALVEPITPVKEPATTSSGQPPRPHKTYDLGAVGVLSNALKRSKVQDTRSSKKSKQP